MVSDKYEEAKGIFLRLIKLDYKKMYILLGYTYYCLHMYQEAIEAYNQDLKYNLENMASTHYHMGLVYIVLEQREKALEEYQILKNLIQNWLKNYLRRYTSRVWYVFNFKDCISNITFMGTKYTSIWLLYNSSVCCHRGRSLQRIYLSKPEKKIWTCSFGIITILFNPFAPIHLNKDTWAVIDVLVAIFFIVSLFL